MKRKNFIANSTILGLSVTTLSLDSCNNIPAKEKNETMTKNETLDFELDEATIEGLQQKMQEGKLSSHSITELYLNRIEAIDKNGPGLHAVIELNPDALKDAGQLDEERKNGKVRSAMHGIPVLIKDNIEVRGLSITAGSLAMEGHMAKQDAFIIKQLREAGAVILGKTNLSEWANIRGKNPSSGWSSRGGQTKNPYILDRNPCGSSSGSGVSVAANLCAVAVGTETDGSIVCPSSINGIVGLKPTVGLLSRNGIIPISETQDTAGPMARTVKDAALLLGSLTGVDELDKITLNSKGKSQADYTTQLKVDALKGKRVGIEKKWKSVNTGINGLYKTALEDLQKAGAVLVEIELIEAIDKLGEAEHAVMLFEFKDGLNRYLQNANAPVKSLSDLIAFNQKNEARVMPFFKQEIFEAAEKTTGLNSKEYRDALAKSRDGSRKIIDTLISANKLDAIAGITVGPACAIDLMYGDRWGDVGLTSPPAQAGYPHITVPCGFVFNLPVGLSFFSKPYSEPELLGMAYAYEQLTKARKKPTFLNTFDEKV